MYPLLELSILGLLLSSFLSEPIYLLILVSLKNALCTTKPNRLLQMDITTPEPDYQDSNSSSAHC